ncbi:MAG: ribonuclease H-like YkuK family protein [Bacteroidota bacterium]|nr:ribonuclease H-like YkuK family protein [Bacteroidota bacterium]
MEDSHRKFTIMGGRLKHDVCDYITAMTSESEVEVHVGCDSQNHKRHTVYVTTVVFRFPNNGAHVIYRRERVPKILDMWTKLWGETERSVELANLILEECNLRVNQIDLDFNSDSQYASHKLVSASSGYITSLGFKSKVKPDLLMAAWAANVLCQ